MCTVNSSTPVFLTVKLPNLQDSEAVQKFFVDEIQLGEECISRGL